jgi:hypothetical protein
MANKLFGEARLPLADGRELTVRFDFGALCEAEEAANKSTDQMMQEMVKGGARLTTARAMLYGGLRYHHPGITLDEVGEILLTDASAASEAVGKAMSEMADRRAGANPRTGPRAVKAPAPRPRGIGTRSSKPGAKAA